MCIPKPPKTPSPALAAPISDNQAADNIVLGGQGRGAAAIGRLALRFQNTTSAASSTGTSSIAPVAASSTPPAKPASSTPSATSGNPSASAIANAQAPAGLASLGFSSAGPLQLTPNKGLRIPVA